MGVSWYRSLDAIGMPRWVELPKDSSDQLEAALRDGLDEIQVPLSTSGPAAHTTVGLPVASRSAILTVDLLGKEKVGTTAKGAGVMCAVRELDGRKHYHEIRRAGGTMLGETRGGYPGPSTIVLPAPV